jgi:hypothetical protein
MSGKRTQQQAELMRAAMATVQGALDARPATWISHGELVKTMVALVAADLPEIQEVIFEAMERFGRNRNDVIVEEDVRYTGDQPRYAIAILIKSQSARKGRR